MAYRIKPVFSFPVSSFPLTVMASPLIFVVSLVLFQLGRTHRIEIITTSRPDGKVAEFDCNKPADVVFILDGSKWMTFKNFSQQLDFVKHFIDDIDVSQNIVRIGVASISTKLRVDFSLNTYRTKDEVKAALTKITDPQGKTNTWLALEYLRTRAFSADNGGRVGVPKIAIILTDSGSKDKEKTIAEAKRLHNEPIRVYVIGVERVSLDELKAIASKPDNIYLSSDYTSLKDIHAPLKENVCKIVCGLTPLDVIFMLDESTSLWNADYEKQTEFVGRFIRDSVIGPDYTQVGVVTFNTKVTNHFFLNQHEKSADMLKAVEAMNRTYGDSYTDKALRFITAQGFTREHGGRNGVPHVVIVITDGQSSSPSETWKAADEIQKAGVTLFAIGIGSSVDVNELNVIAGGQARVFQVRSYNALKGVEPSLFSRVGTLRHAKTG